MTHNRIERLERDLVARRRRRGRRDVTSARPRDTVECASRAFDADVGDAINLLCDRASRGYAAGASYVDAFDAVAAVDSDAGPNIDDPTTAGTAVLSTPDASADPTTTAARSDPTIAGAAVDPTHGIQAMADPTIEPPSASRSPAPDDLRGWQVTSEAPDQETAFAQDVAAILAHTRGDDTVRTPAPVPAPSSPPPVPTPAPAMPQMGVGATSGHDIFDRMSSANRYDQGPVALSVDFAAMDQAIDRGQTSAPLPPPAAPADAATPAMPAPAPAPAPGDTGPSPTPDHASTPAPDSPPSAEVADVAAVDAITTASGPFRVTTDVPLVAQVPGLSCHAAACASIVAWRDDVTPVPAEVAAATGYWERYAEGRTAVYPDVLEAFVLAHSAMGRAPSATALKDLIERAGPLWVSASPPGERAVVVSGVTGDGTSSGTMVDVVDPWARGMTTFGSPNPGSTYHQSLADLLAGIAGGAGNPVVIAQLKEGPAR